MLPLIDDLHVLQCVFLRRNRLLLLDARVPRCHQLVRRALADVLVHVGQHLEIGNTIGSLLPELGLAVLHYDVLVEEKGPRSNNEVLADPVMTLGPPQLTLVEVGPVTQLIDVADHGQVLSMLRLVLKRQLQVELDLHGSRPPVLLRRHSRPEEIFYGFGCEGQTGR